MNLLVLHRAGTVAVIVQISAQLLAARQLSPPSVNDSLRAILLGFHRTQNAFVWMGELRERQQLSGLWFQTTQNTRSQLLRSGEVSQQDEYAGKTDVSIPLNDLWSINGRLQSQFASPTRASTVGEVSQHQLLGGLTTSPANGFEIFGGGGWELNRQLGESDAGPVASGRLNFQTQEDPQTQYAVGGEFIRSWLKRRSPASAQASAIAVKRIGTSALDSIGVQAGYLQREFYSPMEQLLQAQWGTTNNVFARTERIVKAFNTLVYDVSKTVQLHSLIGVASKDIARGLRYKNFTANAGADESIQEIELSGLAGFSWRMSDEERWTGELQFGSRDERHRIGEDDRFSLQSLQTQRSAASRLENASERFAVRSRWESTGSWLGDVSLSASADIFRYDTPDSTNIDDRDELFLTSLVSWRTPSAGVLTGGVDLELTANHLVYLHRLQSGNNAWNRIIRLAPSLAFVPAKGVRSLNHFEVLANYTVYDFEEQIASVRSYVFRQFSWSDTTQIKLGRTVGWEMASLVRLHERGVVSWKAFKEQPEQFINEVFIFPKFFINLHKGWRLGCGFRSYTQTFYRFVGLERQVEHTLAFQGLAATLDGQWQDGSTMSIEGWNDLAVASSSSNSVYLTIQLRYQL